MVSIVLNHTGNNLTHLTKITLYVEPVLADAFVSLSGKNNKSASQYGRYLIIQDLNNRGLLTEKLLDQMRLQANRELLT